jgi:hypothetical protein
MWSGEPLYQSTSIESHHSRNSVTKFLFINHFQTIEVIAC